MAGLNSEYLTDDALRSIGLKAVGSHVLVHSTAVLVNCANISFGSNVRIDPYVVISAGESVTLGNNVHVGAYCSLSGRAAIEMADFAGLSQGVRIFSASDDYQGLTLTNPTVPEAFKAVHMAPVRLGRHVIIGAGAIILPGADLGEGAAVGALSLVDRPLDGWSIYAGTPARRLKARSRGLLVMERLYLQASGGGHGAKDVT